MVYSGPEVMTKFYEHVMSESKVLGEIIACDEEMKPLIPEQQAEYDQATSCFSCGHEFSSKNWKVRHHCHISGNFLFAACNNCNLQLKMIPGKRKRKYEKTNSNKRRKLNTKEKAKEEFEENYFIPVVFHNLKSYDAHFVIKHLKSSILNETTVTTNH